jgi:hypothetical protein
MTDFARRDFLLTGAGISAAWTSARGGERPSRPEPDRFEAVAGFELAEVVKSHPLALVPLGSLEYHGPHNPLAPTRSLFLALPNKWRPALIPCSFPP